MSTNEERDHITIEDEQGIERDYSVEALFDMEDESYALLSSSEEMLVMRVEEEEGQQYLIGITDSDERDAILDAYALAVEAQPENVHPYQH
ncbi:DUF1292 domain-containing protein [Bacillus sp. FJAT-45350]|uniref:DUF1292 domain-containing protein n=1 Tax=Bacillus sp. FJAT-45350 TaxID=2011014 RepID=UPI000BB9A69B|nr:DUF1292 domain-containing protein [Bacillus sp. FJAT-45350]